MPTALSLLGGLSRPYTHTYTYTHTHTHTHTHKRLINLIT